MSSVALQVSGLKEFRRSLKQLDGDLPKALRIAMNRAAELVVEEARPGVPKASGAAARSIRPQSTGVAVRVTAGGTRAPYYPWLDFGGRVGRRKATVRPFSTDGRYLYPAYFRLRDAGVFEEALAAALVDVAAAAGLEVE
jgi:hypothetical protein